MRVVISFRSDSQPDLLAILMLHGQMIKMWVRSFQLIGLLCVRRVKTCITHRSPSVGLSHVFPVLNNGKPYEA